MAESTPRYSQPWPEEVALVTVACRESAPAKVVEEPLARKGNACEQGWCQRQSFAYKALAKAMPTSKGDDRL
ncbi:hypothetical protein B296_00026464 [Ensete ventricosum]|uniref:Uncharacterized protein n=1 Tax=Ensete ventricosum TaxID=4639 RepID=A0A427A0U7_ENSVE|nr:hypothetical protein B296_00026464 [Ensete ventricosum]